MEACVRVCTHVYVYTRNVLVYVHMFTYIEACERVCRHVCAAMYKLVPVWLCYALNKAKIYWVLFYATGRPWKKDELRLKSNDDLHKLWYALHLVHLVRGHKFAEWEPSCGLSVSQTKRSHIQSMTITEVQINLSIYAEVTTYLSSAILSSTGCCCINITLN